MSQEQAVLIECGDCPFSTTVKPEDNELPADVLVDHGREYGHILSIHKIEE